jgi:hypothetical protein
MQKVIPFVTAKEAVAALDNGGRFYNFFTKADDGIITPAELAKVAGAYSNTQQMMVYLAMSVNRLGSDAVTEVNNKLSPALQQAQAKYLPQHFTPSQAINHSVLAQSAIITGIPHLLESKAEFNGFIIVPMMAGNVTTMMMIPMINNYDVYEIHDTDAGQSFFVAHARGTEKLPNSKVSVGGIIKELKTSKSENGEAKKYLEALYYSEVD